MVRHEQAGIAAAAGLIVAGAVLLLKRSRGAKGKTFVLRDPDSGIEVLFTRAILRTLRLNAGPPT